jgi:hypothetical protein
MRQRLGWVEATLFLVAWGLLTTGCDRKEGWPWIRNMFDHPGPISQEDTPSPPENSLPTDVKLHPGYPLTGPENGGAEEPPGERAKELFGRYCAVCHAADGKGRELTEDYFTPDLTEVEYLERLDEDIYSVILEGGLNMPDYRDVLSEREVRLVVGYLRSLQGADEK